MFAVTIFAKKRKNVAIKNLLGEPGVIFAKVPATCKWFA